MSIRPRRCGRLDAALSNGAAGLAVGDVVLTAITPGRILIRGAIVPTTANRVTPFDAASVVVALVGIRTRCRVREGGSWSIMPTDGTEVRGRSSMRADATFVFEGTVRRVGDSNVASVPADTSTAVVLVTRAVRVPDVLSHLVGREITVVLSEPITRGTVAVLSTVGWVYAESVAVVELEREPATEVASMTADQQQEVAWAQATTDRVGGAEQIVLGQVTGMQPHPRFTPRASEHDPQWWVAEVSVDTVLKGPRSRAVEATFSNSMDVLWHSAPKLRPAQTAILLLHRGADELPDRRSRAVLRVQDVHAPDKLEAIATML
jgi:hypothetical protein